MSGHLESSGLEMTTASQVGVMPAAMYTMRAPSPPRINVPPVLDRTRLNLPAYDESLLDADIKDPESREILRVVTGGDHRAQAHAWVYESRRKYQAILPFLHLGPSTASKDIATLKEDGISLLLVIRDTRSAISGLLSGKKIADQLGIDHAAVDVDGNAQLIHIGFSRAISIINDHLISRYQQHASSLPTDADAFYTTKTAARGKVLVFCESGNERSAAVVAAYIMTVYGLDMVSAVQYLQCQRFCIALNDNLKNLLFSYQQILEARRAVLIAQKDSLLQLPLQSTRAATPKRSIDDVDDDSSDVPMDAGDAGYDADGNVDNRGDCGNRKGFAPFHQGAEYTPF